MSYDFNKTVGEIVPPSRILGIFPIIETTLFKCGYDLGKVIKSCGPVSCAWICFQIKQSTRTQQPNDRFGSPKKGPPTRSREGGLTNEDGIKDDLIKHGIQTLPCEGVI